MSEIKTVSLRLPKAMSDAAKTLAKTSFVIPREGDRFDYIAFSSANDAMIYLMKLGLREIIQHVEMGEATLGSTHEAWQAIVHFLLNNPAVARAKQTDFPEGHTAHVAFGLLGEEGEEIVDGVDREMAFSDLAICQRQLVALSAAAHGIRSALYPEPSPFAQEISNAA